MNEHRGLNLELCVFSKRVKYFQTIFIKIE